MNCSNPLTLVIDTQPELFYKFVLTYLDAAN